MDTVYQGATFDIWEGGVNSFVHIFINKFCFLKSPLFGMRQKQAKIIGIATFVVLIKLKPNYFSINSKHFSNKQIMHIMYPFTFHHKSFLSISFVPNRKYSWKFSAEIFLANHRLVCID